MQSPQQSDGAAYAELLAFVAVGDTLSFTRAGRRLARDPSIVSRRIVALEARLGVALLVRSTRSVRLTEPGGRYLERARAIVAALADADAEAASHAADEPHGHLRLALPGSFGRIWLAPILADFLAAHPRITIEAEFSNRFVDLVAERFDLAIRLGTADEPGLVARRIGERRRILCASPDHLARRGTPETPEALAGADCLLFSGLERPREWTLRDARGRTRRVAVSGPLISDDAEVLRHAAHAGRGIVLSTDWMVGADIASGRLTRILPDWQVTDRGAIWIVTPAGARAPARIRAFADFVALRLAEIPWVRLP